jgi:hypothetical protein
MAYAAKENRVGDLRSYNGVAADLSSSKMLRFIIWQKVSRRCERSKYFTFWIKQYIVLKLIDPEN